MTRGLVALGLLASLTGCWDNRPIDHRTLVLTIDFEPGPKPGLMEVAFQAPTPVAMAATTAGSSSGGKKDFFTISGIGDTVSHAFNEAQGETDKDLYLGHVLLLTFSPKLTGEEVHHIFGYLDRVGTLDKTPFVAVTTKALSETVAESTLQTRFPGLYFETLFSCTKCQPTSLGVRFWQASDRFLTPGVDVMMPVITPGKKSPVVNQMGLYDGYKFSTALDPKLTRALGLINGTSKKASLYLPHDWGASLRAVTGPARLSTKVVDGRIEVIIRIKFTATLAQINTPTESAAQLSRISHDASSTLAHRMVEVARLTQKHDADVFGVGRMLSWQHPAAFGPYKADWHQEYPKVDFIVHTKVVINKMGDIK